MVTVDPIRAAKVAKATTEAASAAPASGGESVFKDLLAQAQQPTTVNANNPPDRLPQIPLNMLQRHMTPEQLASFVAEMVPDIEKKKRRSGGVVAQAQASASQGASTQGMGSSETLYAQAAEPDAGVAPVGAQEGLQPVRQTLPYTQDSAYVTPRSSRITPFQFFIEKSLEYFQRVSAMEMQTDQLMVDYIEGRASIEELTIEKAKVSVALSFAVTIIQQVTNAFNEIKNMSI